MVTIPARTEEIAIFGAGPAGLLAAEIIASMGRSVVVFERMPSPARKFLMAGRGGLNLTHSEDLCALLSRYGADADGTLRQAIEEFPPSHLVQWASGLGCETFIGSSGRVFPKAMKASPLLRAWLRRLRSLGVVIETRHEWAGFARGGGSLVRGADGSTQTVMARATLLACGGGSWPRLGSDGGWVDGLHSAGVAVTPLTASNCGVSIGWSPIMRETFHGAPLKRIALSTAGTRARGECVITREGLEGGVVYQLVPAIREALRRDGFADVHLDLRPDQSHADILGRLRRPRGRATLTNHLRKTLNLDRAAIALLREAPLPDDAGALADRIKGIPLRVGSIAPIERAISTAGGVAWPALDQSCMLTSHPGVFVAGEMLDWDAPTGGYLLQGTFATAHKAARGILNWLDHDRPAAKVSDSVPRSYGKME